jgi:uncharacterized protein (DUF1684 family)
MGVQETAELWDWRRRVADVYAAVRGTEDPRVAWEHWRAARDELFGGHPQTPLDAAALPGFRGLAYFPYDPALRFRVRLVPGDGGTLEIPAGGDGTVTLCRFARTDGLRAALGGELSLFWMSGYGGGVFLPFADATSGRQSYGGGRYLLDTIKSADLGRDGDCVVLDFNFAYFPSCAYSPHWVCPLAPAENRLPGAVRGGERLA